MHRNCRRMVLRFGKCIYLRLGKLFYSFTYCIIANPYFVRQSFIFLLYQNQVCFRNEHEKFGKKQSAILRLIKSITKFSIVIGYYQPDLSTYNIPKKITRVWLAENGCILYVTRVQMTSSAPKISVVTFLTGWQTILIMLVWRILYNYSATYALESFHN